MNNGNKIYTFYGLNPAPIAAMTNYNLTWNLNNNNRRFKLLSVFFDINLSNAVTLENLSVWGNSFYRHGLNVGQTPNVYIGKAFENFTAGFVPNTGSGFQIFTPGQYHFKNFFVSNFLDFGILVQNLDPLVTLNFETTVVCEIEDIG